jgi:hypothetical protein
MIDTIEVSWAVWVVVGVGLIAGIIWSFRDLFKSSVGIDGEDDNP